MNFVELTVVADGKQHLEMFQTSAIARVNKTPSGGAVVHTLEGRVFKLSETYDEVRLLLNPGASTPAPARGSSGSNPRSRTRKKPAPLAEPTPSIAEEPV